jgi:membrane-bound inhibitor of C-type lysozyme
MNVALSSSLLVACVFAAALAASAQTASGPTTVRATFTCDAGKTVAAVFTNGAQSRVALVLSDGRKLTLPQALSGSGARYANADDSFVFWNKGHTAFIDERGKPTYSGCTTPR